jgi:hypothetical protein
MKHKTITKKVRENKKRGIEYWTGYLDGLQAMGECGAPDFSSQAWTYLRELIQDAKGRLEAGLKLREAGIKNYTAPEEFDGLGY